MALVPTAWPATSVPVRVLLDLGLPANVPKALALGHQQHKIASHLRVPQSRLGNEGCPTHQPPHSLHGLILPPSPGRQAGRGGTG